MKRLFILWSLLTSLVYGIEINEDITDIYFGNGVWNRANTAKEGRLALSRVILFDIYNGDVEIFKKRHYSVRDNAEENENIILLSYNWTGVSPGTGLGNIDEYFGYFWDIVETFNQLQREGQLPYFSFFGWLQHSEHSIIREWLDQYFISIDGANIEEMLNRYKTISFSKGHRVFLVSHSQGGKFANRIYDSLTPTWHKDYFANLQVASPASSVHAVKGAYVTFRGDKLINAIPGSMDGNADLNPEDDVLFDLNHEFVSEYLRQTDSLRKIMENIPVLLLELDRTYSQWLIKTEDINTNICEERRAELIHFKETSLTIPIAFPFKTESIDINGTKRYFGKAYPLDVNGIQKYVFASEDGENIINIENQGVLIDDYGNDVGCYLLEGTDDKIKKGCGDANLTEGVLEVDLSWKSPNINLTLSVLKDDVEVGTLDDIGRCPKEHWSIANEADVKAGEYYVHITTNDTANVDDALLPESVKLNIDAPDGGLNISLDIPSADLLDMGKVAKIIVTKPQDGGGGGGVSVEVTAHPDVEYTATRYKTNESGTTYNYEVVSLWNQVALGPIANALVEIMSLSSSDFGQVVYTGYTSNGDNIETSGLILLPSSFKESVTDDGLYLITATGGEDVDANDDLNLDATPTTNFGTIHAIISGAIIKENGLKVNILTEIGYQVSKHLLLNAEDTLGAVAILDEAAQALLNEDMNKDGVISHADLHAWIPSFDKKILRFDYNSKIHPIVLKIYNADDIYDDAYTLIYPNTRPVANAGVDQSISFGESVTLDGSGSYDSDGEIVTYQWREEAVVYCQSDVPTCHIDGLLAGKHTFTLTVSDNNGAFAQDTIDVFVSGSTTLIGTFNTPGFANDVTLSSDGTVAYVADYYKGGLQIIDISNPEASTLIGSYYTGGYAESVALSADENIVYIANGYSGFLILDITNPSAPFQVGKYYMSDYATGVSISADGTLAYVSNGYKGLQIIDVDNPAMPMLIGTCDTPDVAWGVTLSADGTVAYVADGRSGLQVIDITNPTTPSLIGSSDTPGFVQSITLSKDGTMAYVADNSSGLQILDISNPEVPLIIGSHDTSSTIVSVALSEDDTIAYVADWRNGLQIIDITKPTSPSLIGGYDTTGSASDVTLSTDGSRIAYIADRDSGLQIIDISTFVR